MVLALFSFVFTWVVAIPAGIYSAMHPRSVVDYLLTVVNYVGVATPNFMLALVLMWGAFAYFGMSVTGLFSPEFVDAPWSVARVLDLLSHVWLPAVVLGVAGTARLTRVMRANLLDELNKPYVTTARAKGLSEWRLVVRYPARLALNPLVSTIGWYLPALFSGSLIVATVMNLPNIGPLLLRALINQDMYLAGSILLIYCFLTIVGTLISDILLAWLDPRIRLERDEMSVLASRRRRPRGPRVGRLELAAGLVAVRKHRLALAERPRADRPLPGRAVPGLLQHAGSRGHRGAAGVHSDPAPASLRRMAAGPWVPDVVGKRNPTPCAWSGGSTRAADPGALLVTRSIPTAWLGVIPTRIHLLGTAAEGRDRLHLLGTDRLGRDQWSRLVHGTRTSMTIGLTAVTFSDRARRPARRHLRLLRRARRRHHPAADRALAVAADDPHLAGAHRRAAARLVAAAGVLRDHGDPVAGGLDDARARGTRRFLALREERFRAGSRAGGGQSAAGSSSATWCQPSSRTSSRPARSRSPR
jgi:ABC-type dipeptide/oligopeptide/nickel transport system permease component